MKDPHTLNYIIVQGEFRTQGFTDSLVEYSFVTEHHSIGTFITVVQILKSKNHLATSV